jgi:hypothetical protein
MKKILFESTFECLKYLMQKKDIREMFFVCVGKVYPKLAAKGQVTLVLDKSHY